MNYFAYLLTVVFVVAKILNYIAWPWLIVFLPMIVLFSIYFAIFLFAVVMATGTKRTTFHYKRRNRF